MTMKELRLAVISDIHVGEGARAKDLCPTNAPGRDAKPDDKYREKFVRFLKDKNITADYLILPGDITNHAIPDEVKIASEFIEEVSVALNVKSENIVFVPGNHDVDWSVFNTSDTTGLRRGQRYDPIRYKDFHFNSIAARGDGCLFESPHFTIWNYPDMLVVGYNSSHHDEPKKFHHGLIDTAHLEEMQKALEGLALDKDKLRLFLVHHHMIQYDDPTPETPDSSIMVNAEKLQAFLRKFQFDILIHGHKHVPRFTAHSTEGFPEIVILCSGSFSVQIDTRWTGTISNQFHLVKIAARDPEEHLIMGQVESWSYNYARGWKPSDAAHDGIPHVEPFGTYIRPEKLKLILRPLLEAHFAKIDFVEWTSIVKEEQSLRHLRPEVIVRVLDELALLLGFKRHHDLPEKIILLKGK